LGQFSIGWDSDILIDTEDQSRLVEWGTGYWFIELVVYCTRLLWHRLVFNVYDDCIKTMRWLILIDVEDWI